MKATIPIGIQPGTKLLQLSYEPDTQSYVLWLHHDKLMKHGTYLHLCPDGKVERVTVGLDGMEDVTRVS